MVRIDRDEIRECIGEGALTAHAMVTAEPFFRALENGLTLVPREQIFGNDVKKAVRALGGFAGYLFQTPEDIAKSGNKAVETALAGIGLEEVGFSEIESSGVFDEPLDEAFTTLLGGKIDEHLIDLVCMVVGEVLIEFFKNVEEGNEERVQALTPLISLLPKAIPTPFGNKGMLTFLVG